MGTNSKIKDGEGTSLAAGVKNTESFGNGLKVYSYEGNPLGLGTRFFTNDTYGSNINKDATTGGTPDQVHDGIDSSLWTASAISGSWTFNSATQAHGGTQSINATATTNNNVAQFAKGSNLTIANYVTLTGWIYITGWSTGGSVKEIEVIGWDTGTAAAVSSIVNLSDYINTTSFNVWQKFSIPFADFAFTASTLDAIRVTTRDQGGGPPPNYFLDDLQFEQTGGAIIYSVGPPPGKIWKITNVSYILADAYAGTVTNGTMPSIPYDGFLGVSTLAIGTIVRRIQLDEVKFSNTTTDLIDYLSTGAPKKVLSGSDGVNTWVRLEAEYPHHILLYLMGIWEIDMN